jgi:methionine synthase I (cobalamin-dependent)
MRYNRQAAMDFRKALNERILVAEGAMGTRLFSKRIAPGECLEELNLSHPSLVREIHEEYRQAGADIFKSNTFGANEARLSRHGLDEKCREINIAGVQIAKAVAGNDGFVAGVVGPMGPLTGAKAGPQARRMFAFQIEALAEAGADFILLETFRNLNELKAALHAARDVCELPIVAQVSPDADGNLEGDDGPALYVPQMVEWGADAIGCNCGAGVAAMVVTMRRIAQRTDKPLTAQPSAGLPFLQEGLTVYPCLPEEMAGAAKKLARMGPRRVRMLGGCCGTTPEHIAAMRKALDAMLAKPNSSPVA